MALILPEVPLTLYEGICEMCGATRRDDLGNYAPKFAQHVVDCDKGCGGKVRLAKPLVAPVDNLDHSLGLREIQCASCHKFLGLANLGAASRLGKVCCSRSCVKKHFKIA